MTPEERASIVREKEKATTSVVVLAAGMALWAGSVFLKGGYTDQPEHHAMWRFVALLPAFWGIVLLIIFRYSWTNLISALVMSVSGFYLANAPTVGQVSDEYRRPAVTTEASPKTVSVRKRVRFADTARWNNLQLAHYCWDISARENRAWNGDDPPCSQAEVEAEAGNDPDRYQSYAGQRLNK